MRLSKIGIALLATLALSTISIGSDEVSSEFKADMERIIQGSGASFVECPPTEREYLYRRCAELEFRFETQALINREIKKTPEVIDFKAWQAIGPEGSGKYTRIFACRGHAVTIVLRKEGTLVATVLR